MTAPAPSPTAHGERRLVTDREVAQLLGISRRTVWALHDLPRISIGPRATRWDLRDVEQYISARRTLPIE